MRRRRLDLARDGQYTDHSLDFGPHRDGAPDLHIIYGPNEAGESPTLNAFLDLLYGSEARSRYNFLHPSASMRLGAAVAFAGDPSREVARGSRGLVQGHGAAVPAVYVQRTDGRRGQHDRVRNE